MPIPPICQGGIRPNLTVASRIGLLLLFMIVFATGISITYNHFMGKVGQDALKTTQNTMRQGYERTLKATVQTLATTLGSTVHTALQKGQDPLPLLRKTIQNVRYDEQGYYFIYNFDGVNIAHPYHPEFQGKQRINIEDSKGTQYIRELVKKVQNGGGFVTYWFNKPKEALPSPKLVYAQQIPQTDYWLATGLYIDDINAEQARVSTSFNDIANSAKWTVGIGVSLVLLLVVLPTSLIMISGILQPWRQMEKELRHAQKMEAIGIFAGGIAHDFNNILGAITSCSELALTDTPEDSPVQEDLRHVLKAAKRGKALVKRIKAFSQRTDSGRQRVQMNSILNEAIHLLQTFMPATIDMKVAIHCDRAQVKAAPDQLLQVIMNLCTNAEQAMRGLMGTLTITLDVVELDIEQAREVALPTGNYVCLSVSDTGIGMKPVVQNHIFEPFYTTRKKTGGTGLGLSMSHSMIKKHGGTITVDSIPGHGATFRVYLPYSGEAVAEDTAEPTLSLPRGTESILIVDDDKDLGYSVNKLFNRLGYSAVFVNNSPDALSLFRKSPYAYDLIITDQMMPVMKGSELTKKIHKIRPDLPVILYSGFENNGLLPRLPRNWRKAGFAAFFSKPFETSALCREVRNLLDAQKEPTELAKTSTKQIDHAYSSHN